MSQVNLILHVVDDKGPLTLSLVTSVDENCTFASLLAEWKCINKHALNGLFTFRRIALSDDDTNINSFLVWDYMKERQSSNVRPSLLRDTHSSAKAQNIEHGLCQNFVQLQVACE
ncbi:37_t:CDS:2, partial [Dentiscutata erythropus]